MSDNRQISINDITITSHHRAIKPHALQQITESIKDHGYNSSYPITVDADFNLVDGLHRLEAARALGKDSLPYVFKPDDVSSIRFGLQCNADGQLCQPDDVFDYAELCWSLAQDGWTGQQIADELGWSQPKVVQYQNIKTQLCPSAWNAARGITKNSKLAIDGAIDIVIPNITNVINWSESHFRAFLKHLPYKENDRPDSVTRYAQVQAIKDILSNFADPKKRVTAQSIAPIAQRHAWHAELVKYIIANLVPEVTSKDKCSLIKNAYGDVFGRIRPDKDDPLDKIKKAVSALNEKALGVKLYQDDTFQRIPLLEDKSVALVVTDPPYNVTENEWDKVGTDEEYIGFMRQWLAAVRPKLADDYHLFVFCAQQYQAAIETMMQAEGWPIKSRLIWVHRNMSKGRQVADKFIASWDMVLHCGTHPLNFPPEWGNERQDVQEFAIPQSNFSEGKHHPTAKPVGLITRLVELGSKPGDTVLDMFAGGGTTGQACANIGQRRCILIEKSSDFCIVIERRLGVQRVTEVVDD